MATKRVEVSVAEALALVREQYFHPLDENQAFTLDRTLKVPGVADLEDPDGRVRLLAVRDLVRAGASAIHEIEAGLGDRDADVRQVSALALGVLRATGASTPLERVAGGDANAMVRSQAVTALGQVESRDSLETLRRLLVEDPSRDVRHQCELAIDQIEKGMGATGELRKAFEGLDEEDFGSVRPGMVAPDFALEDTEGEVWRVGDFRDRKWVLLIWVFADWCPVCHREFKELLELRAGFEEAGVQVFTIECHDRYRGRVMVGKELEPEYWFAEHSFKEAYTEKIWWPHLLDRAGAVGSQYGVDPMTFVVHAEYINRPSTVIVDPEGVVRLAYHGTFWGDRPSVEQTLDMIRSGRFDFEHPDRRKLSG